VLSADSRPRSRSERQNDTREADAYAETLPEPLGREGAIQFFDALIEARGGR